MSMRISPHHGFVVKAEDYLKAIGATDAEIAKAMEEEGWPSDQLMGLAHRCAERFVLNVPMPWGEAFRLADADEADNMDYDTWYFQFLDDAVVQKFLTPQAECLKSLGVELVYEDWGIWG